MKKAKKVQLVLIASEIKAGLKPIEISKTHNIPMSKMSRSLATLKELGCIEKLGYGSWQFLKEVAFDLEVTTEVKTQLLKKDIRGHAFIWNIEFLEGGYNWKQIVKNYEKRYKKPKLNFKMICGGKVPRTIFKNRKVWLTKAGLTIYEPMDFFGGTAFKVKGDAVFEMDKMIKELLAHLKLKLQFYRFKCSREHFAHVKNEMARQFNDEKKKIYVEFDGKHFWIDHSHGENEEESDDPNVSVQAQKFYKSQVKTMFKFTPEVIADLIMKNANAIKENAKSNKVYGDNSVTHVALMDRIAGRIDKMDARDERFLKVMEKLANK